MSQVQLSNASVEIIDHVTWGQRERLKALMMAVFQVQPGENNNIDVNAEAILRAKFAAIEMAIKAITVDGQTVPYSREWVENLSTDDGDILFAAVEKVTTPAKK
jgi:hypothetical protein